MKFIELLVEVVEMVWTVVPDDENVVDVSFIKCGGVFVFGRTVQLWP